MPKRPDRTPEQLKQLAQDFVGGQIFTDRDICDGDPRLCTMVFLPLALMSPKDAAAFAKQKPVLIFEYVRAAGPRSINGYPTFFSCRYMNQREFDQFRELVTQIQAAIAAVPAAPPKPKRKRGKDGR